MTATITTDRRPGQSARQREQSPAFLFYVSDWRGSLKVRAMNFATRGMFLELLLEQWHSGAVPASAADCARLLGGQKSEWTRAWPKLRVCFVARKRDGFLVNPKLERVREERLRYQKAQAQSGLRGARARWRKHGKPIGSPSAQYGEPIMSQMASPSDDTMANHSLSSSSSSSSNLKEKDHSRRNKHSRSRLSPVSESFAKAYREVRK